jgi:UDP-N-acetyl-D-mannosaminuronic acid dehydrogenase
LLNMFDTISIIGLGYIGLPTATLFASHGKNVIGVDIVPHVVKIINRGAVHIIEPDLDMLVKESVASGKLRATLIPEPADVFVIAVPTPIIAGGSKPDLSFIEAAAKSIGPLLKKGDLVVLESTSPVGTTEKLAIWLANIRPDLSFPQENGNEADIQIAYCPERVLPGRVIHELVSNDRVIGGMSQKASEMAMNLYRVFLQGKCYLTNARTAEMCKLAENSSRDVSIAFANELSMICQKLDINIWELISLANRHPRVNILQPGAGVGGHCIAVDPWFIIDKSPDQTKLIKMAREVNNYKPWWVLEQINQSIKSVLMHDTHRTIKSIKVTCMGLAFKPNIDDLRESPAMLITQELAKIGCMISIVEPYLKEVPNSLKLDNVKLTSFDEALENTDILCILVKHDKFLEFKERITHFKCTIDAVGI